VLLVEVGEMGRSSREGDQAAKAGLIVKSDGSSCLSLEGGDGR